MRLALNNRRQTTNRSNLEALKSERVALGYAEEVSRLLDVNNPGESIEEMWSACTTAIKTAAESVLGQAAPFRKEKWFYEECRRAIDAKNRARQATQGRHTARNREEYSRKRRTATRLLRNKKRAFENTELSKIEQHRDRNEVVNDNTLW